jgi:hypothetical protein
MTAAAALKVYGGPTVNFTWTGVRATDGLPF